MVADGSGYSTHTAELPAPSLALLRDRRLPPPSFPLQVMGPWWGEHLTAAAEGAGAPVDYIAAGLLATASALIGNARWARVWDGWTEPPFLWIGCVGTPSSGKSPGLAVVLRDVLDPIEHGLAADFPATLRGYETRAAEARERRSVWEGEVKNAVKNGAAPPEMPAAAAEVEKPSRPRVRSNDATLEKVAILLRDLPRGLLLHRDELAAFFGQFDRYSGGGDRAAWLETYSAGRFVVDRVKHPEPVVVPRFGLSVLGTIQPDKLAEVNKGPDDGLMPRFLWFWPEPRPFARPKRAADADAMHAALARLPDELALVTAEDGSVRPWFVPFDDSAAAVIEDAGREWAAREREAAGPMIGALGKARGQAVRLALVLEHLWWCVGPVGASPPRQVGALAAKAACAIVDDYALPMAERVYGDAAVPATDRSAATLLRHVVKNRIEIVNERQVRDTPGLPGLTEAAAVKAAVARLQEDHVLLPVAERPAGAGRPRADHRVNPKLWAVVAAAEAASRPAAA